VAAVWASLLALGSRASELQRCIALHRVAARRAAEATAAELVRLRVEEAAREATLSTIWRYGPRLRHVLRMRRLRRCANVLVSFLSAVHRMPSPRKLIAGLRADVIRLQRWWRARLATVDARARALCARLELWEGELLGDQLADEKSVGYRLRRASGLQVSPHGAAPRARLLLRPPSASPLGLRSHLRGVRPRARAHPMRPRAACIARSQAAAAKNARA
jgi:hypothetical protein